MASPHPKPGQIKKLQGTDRADRANEDRMDPQKVIDVPKPPEYLGKYGKALWNEQLEQLATLQMLTKVDLVVLGQYCWEWDTYRDAIAEIKKDGFKNSYDQISPAVTVKNQSFKNMLQIADRFGFVASAREKITMPENKKADPLEQHLAKIHKLNNTPETTIEEWGKNKGLHGRIINALKDAGINKESELEPLTKKTLKSINGIGPKSLKELLKAKRK